MIAGETKSSVSGDSLKAFTKDIFQAADVSEEHAEVWADMLVWANLRGMDSHGVLRIPRYIDYIRNGNIHARPNMKVENPPGRLP